MLIPRRFAFLFAILSMVSLSPFVARADAISDDEAAIALHIEALHDESGEARETAAAALRAIVA
ncbi:MAG: hypothetical protein ACREHD_15185, partial [Pirellulales bacterium]